MAKFFIVMYTPIQMLEILSMCTESKQTFMAPYQSGSTSGAFQSNSGEFGTLALEISSSQNTWEVCYTPSSLYFYMVFLLFVYSLVLYKQRYT